MFAWGTRFVKVISKISFLPSGAIISVVKCSILGTSCMTFASSASVIVFSSRGLMLVLGVVKERRLSSVAST